MRRRLIIAAVFLVVGGVAVSLSFGALEKDGSDEASTPAPAAERTVRAWPVVRGSNGGVTRWSVGRTYKQRIEICPLDAADDYYVGCTDSSMTIEEFATLPFDLMKGYRVEERVVGNVPEAALKQAEFVTRVLAGSRAHRKPTVDVPQVHDAMSELFRGRVDETKLAAWVEKHKSDDALYEALTHYWLLEPDAMDIMPFEAATLLAELALARGDVPTFVDMQVLLISDFFPNDWARASAQGRPTRAERLAKVNIDVDALLLGLLFQYPGSPGDVPVGRLARAMRDAGRAEALLPKVEALATSQTLDSYNRFRATSVWLQLQLYDDKSDKNAPAVLRKAATLNLDPLSRERLKYWRL